MIIETVKMDYGVIMEEDVGDGLSETKTWDETREMKIGV